MAMCYMIYIYAIYVSFFIRQPLFSSYQPLFYSLATLVVVDTLLISVQCLVRDDILLNDPDCPNGTEHFCEGRSLAKSEAVQLDRQIRNELRSGRTRLRPKNVYEEAKSLISERFAHYDEETRAEIERNFISYGSARRAYSRCAAMFASGEPIGYGKSKKLKLGYLYF